MNVEIIDSSEGLERVEEEWLDLFTRSDEHYIHQDPRLLRAFFVSERGRSHPLVVLLRDGGRLVCIAPFFTWKGAFQFAASVVTLAKIPARMLKLTCERMVYDREVDKRRCTIEAMHAVKAYRDRYDYMVLPELTLPSNVLDVLDEVEWTALELRGKRDSSYRHNLLFETHDEFLSSLSRKRRKNIRYDTRDWRDSPFTRVTKEEQVDGFLDAVAAISEHSWQGKTLDSWTDRRHESYRGYLKAFANLGWLRCYLLENDAKEPMAFIMGFQGYGTLHYEEIGFDGRHRDSAPGIAATHLMMEDLYAENRPRTIDFGYGDNRYKEVIANEVLETRPLHLLDRRRWRAAFATQRGIDQLTEHARRLAAEHGVEDRLRDFLKRGEL